MSARPKVARGKQGRTPQVDPLTTLNQRVGTNIRKFRKQQGMTQEGLAEATNLSTFFIGSVERGQATISLRSLAEVARVLDCQVGDLIGHVEERDVAPLQRRASELVKRCQGEDLRLVVAMLQRICASY